MGFFKETNLIAFALTKHLTALISKKYDLEQGWISLLAISKENSDIDLIGSRLFKEVERDFKKNGVKKYILVEILKIFYRVCKVI